MQYSPTGCAFCAGPAPLRRNLLAEWCGGGHPIELSSFDSILYVHFHSDGSTQLRGTNMSFVQYGK